MRRAAPRPQASFNHVLVLRLAQQVQAVAESLDHAYKATHDVRGSDYVTVDVASADAIGAVKAVSRPASSLMPWLHRRPGGRTAGQPAGGARLPQR